MTGEFCEQMIAGERDPAALSALAKGVLAKKSEQLAEALRANFTTSHGVLCHQIISQIDHLDQSIAELTREIALRIAPFQHQVSLLSSIPGVSQTTAETIIVETGGDMSKFPTSGHLCAGAGVAPASYESAGKKRPAGTRKGSPWLRRTLIEAARAAAHTKNSYCSAQYARIARRRGPNKAAVAVAHSILDTSWHLLTTGAYYKDPGSDYFERHDDPLLQVKRLQKKIESFGYSVTLTEKAAL